MNDTVNKDTQAAPRYVLRLFVSGATPRSAQAIGNIRAICDRELAGRYELEVIDIYQQPELARQYQIIAVPVLIKSLPAPIRVLIGDLSETEKVLVGLNLHPREDES
ncbi:MAG TPA: circadian clock KaiB family protein [Gallionella sp.]|nr:circadian clock KaiB family protein [Gallionella sp.]